MALPQILAVLLLATLSACSDPPVKEEPEPAPPPPPTRVEVKLKAGNDVNPDGTDRASPVVVRLYQLKDLAKFSASDFFALYEHEDTTLGNDLLKKQEFTLAPGEMKTLGFEAETETKFLAVFAAFRDLNTAQWRASAPIPRAQTTLIDIELTGTRISLSSMGAPQTKPNPLDPTNE